MDSVVLDASALLAVIHAERGSEMVIPKLKGSVISSVNYSEVFKKLLERGGDSVTTQRNIRSLMVSVYAFDEKQACQAAEFWPLAKQYDLSLGDRACLALGAVTGMEILTADKPMADAPTGLRVRIIR